MSAQDFRATSIGKPGTWQGWVAAWVPAFRSYAAWLVSISWKRFAVLSVLLLVLVSIVQRLPPFSWRITEEVERGPSVPKPPAPPPVPRVRIEKPGNASEPTVDITIGADGVRVQRRAAAAAAAASAAS
ncbi:MAG: hypothetical protein ACK4PH_26495, partial [Aquincola tertiaricarbonis]